MTADFYTRAANLSFQGENFWKALGNEVITTMKSIPKEHREDMLVHLGIDHEGMLRECSKYIAKGESQNTWNWLSQTEKAMFKYNFMDYVTTKARNLQALHMSEYHAKIVDKFTWKELGDLRKRHFVSYNIFENEYNTLKDAITIIEHKGLFGIKFKTPFLNPTEIADETLRMDLRTMYVREADMAVLHPEISVERWRMLNSKHKKGTPMYCFLDLVMQFKQFMLSYTKNYLVPIGETFVRDKNYGLFANLAVGLFVTSYATDSLNDLVHGKTPKSLAKFKTWNAIMKESNVFGILTSPVASQTPDEAGRFFIPPTAQKILDAKKGIEDIVNGNWKGAIQSGLKLVPNMLYTKSIMETLFIDNLYESLSPGYRRRQMNKMEADYGQKRIFE